MKNYSLGFMFSKDRERVLLIVKNRPDWQKGKLNGIGGKTEEQDSLKCIEDIQIEGRSEPLACLIREFEEETGLKTEYKDWKHFLTMKSVSGQNGSKTQQYDEPWQVFCYKAFSDDIEKSVTKTDESVRIIKISFLQNHNLIDNLLWIIYLALDTNPLLTITEY